MECPEVTAAAVDAFLDSLEPLTATLVAVRCTR
jgi:hypothetical protein